MVLADRCLPIRSTSHRFVYWLYRKILEQYCSGIIHVIIIIILIIIFSSFVETHFKLMKPLFEADPLLLPIFVHVCPKTELHLLIRELPPHISLSWLSKLIHECDVWPDKVRSTYVILAL